MRPGFFIYSMFRDILTAAMPKMPEIPMISLDNSRGGGYDMPAFCVNKESKNTTNLHIVTDL